MRKKITTLLAATAFMVLTAATSAMAFPASPQSGFKWVSAPFWTNTDHTTAPATGNSQFQIVFEGFAANKDANFGLFMVDDLNNPTAATRFEVFKAADEPSWLSKTVSFKEEGGIFKVSRDGTTWTDFAKVFGFYFQEIIDGTPNAYYYTYSPLDSDGNADVNVKTAVAEDKSSQALIYFDHAPGSPAFQMTVYGNDLAPVPEPGTMMLLGAGFLGLAIYGKRRRNA